jgi:hypothetical protein
MAQWNAQRTRLSGKPDGLANFRCDVIRVFRVAKAAEPGYTAAEIGAMEFAITARRVRRADDSWMPMAPGVFLLAVAFPRTRRRRYRRGDFNDLA